jgi:hypothetical protein
LLGDPLELEGVRSVGAGKWCQFTAGNGYEGPQAREVRRQNSEFRTSNPEPRTPNLKPSRPPPFIVAAIGRALLADSLEGVRSVGAVE